MQNYYKKAKISITQLQNQESKSDGQCKKTPKLKIANKNKINCKVKVKVCMQFLSKSRNSDHVASKIGRSVQYVRVNVRVT